MTVTLQHDMAPQPTAAEAARNRFVSGMRSFVLMDLAGDMRDAYDGRARALYEKRAGRPVKDGADVHAALRGDPAFNIYSAMRVQTQKMVWHNVLPTVERETDRLSAAAEAVADKPGSVTLDPGLAVPRNVSAIDVHLMPGSYSQGADTIRAGAVYDQGLAIFSMGLMGANLDDIGLSMSRYIATRYPDFRPQRILDVGCTIGHNTLPWKKTYPDAEVRAIDAAPSGLVYGSARAKMQGQEVHFEQMLADDLAYADESFDLVFSSMFLHEISAKTRAKVFAEAHRVLKPGGLMLHMELPPNKEMEAYDGFYLDWDSFYNLEPYYKGFRDDDPKAACVRAGFAADDYIQFVVPSFGIYGPDAIAESVKADDMFDKDTGRLAEGVRWFGFGAWKR